MPRINQHIELFNDPSELDRLVMFVEQFSCDSGIAERVAFEIQLVLEELFTNIIRHAFNDRDTHVIEVTLTSGPGQVFIRVVDDGRAFDIREIPQPDTEAPAQQRPVGGLGIYLVNKYIDGIDYQRRNGKNILSLTKHLDPETNDAASADHP